MPPIPIVLRCSFLFLLARIVIWGKPRDFNINIFGWWEHKGEKGKGRNEGLRTLGMGTWRKAQLMVISWRWDLLQAFLMPPMPIVLWCSFLFLLVHMILYLSVWLPQFLIRLPCLNNSSVYLVFFSSPKCSSIWGLDYLVWLFQLRLLPWFNLFMSKMMLV